jgi:hypothetical protein
MRRAAGPLSFVLILSGAPLAIASDEERSVPTTSFAVSTERVKVTSSSGTRRTPSCEA